MVIYSQSLPAFMLCLSIVPQGSAALHQLVKQEKYGNLVIANVNVVL
jgi:hypothetical protein